LAMCSNDAHHFGERILDRAVTIDELEGFAIDGAHSDFELWAFWGVDYSADFETEYFTGEYTVFTNWKSATILNGGGELFV